MKPRYVIVAPPPAAAATLTISAGSLLLSHQSLELCVPADGKLPT